MQYSILKYKQAGLSRKAMWSLLRGYVNLKAYHTHKLITQDYVNLKIKLFNIDSCADLKYLFLISFL
jgi:hypothetical protein